MTINYVFAQWVLSIWNPDLMNFLPEPKCKRQRLFYRTKGIVLHDRELNKGVKE